MDESLKVNNIRTLHQIIEDVLRESVNDISRTDLSDLIKTAMWRPDKDNKSVQRFMALIPNLSNTIERFRRVSENAQSVRHKA